MQEKLISNSNFSQKIISNANILSPSISTKLLKNFNQNISIQSYEKILYLIKYILVYRIASLKNLLPYSNFVVCFIKKNILCFFFYRK